MNKPTKVQHVTKPKICLNCKTEQRPIYKAGYCKKCYRWAMQLKRTENIPISDWRETNFGKNEAQIALEELAWCEEPFVKGDCHPLRLESMFHAVSAECRSEIGFPLSDILHNMSERDRFRCYRILLAIVENAPRDAPVLHTFRPSMKGAYMQEWSSCLRDRADRERQNNLRLLKNSNT